MTSRGDVVRLRSLAEGIGKRGGGWSRGCAGVAMLAVVLWAGRATGAEPRRYEARRAVDRIVIDGRADERTWAEASRSGGFREAEPVVGATPPVDTQIRVAYDDRALYVLVEAFDEVRPVARTLARDNWGIFDDDAIWVVVDPLHTHREAFAFVVNAEGVQMDVLGLHNGGSWFFEWDAVWTSEAARTEHGYTVELEIPLALLGLRRSDDARTMGLGVFRDHARRNAIYHWQLAPPPAGELTAAQLGHLTGIRSLEARRMVELRPYVLGRTELTPRLEVDPRRSPNLATGGELRLQLGTASQLELTYNTDVAQVEVDDIQLVRDRFPLFFPERRRFFTNGLAIFDFGLKEQGQLFFSRRVGLVDGRPVPILGGTKVYGTAGPVSYGALHVQTLAVPSAWSSSGEGVPADGIGVGRVRTQVTDWLAVGAIGLGRHRWGEQPGDHAAFGADASIITAKERLQIYGFVAASVLEEATAPERELEAGSSAAVTASYSGLLLRPRLGWLWSDRDFRPALGFYRRTAASRQQAAVDVVPRPQVLGLRELEVGPHASVETTAEYDRLLARDEGGHARLVWANGAELGYSLEHFVDRVTEPFELHGHTVDAQRYTGLRHQVVGQTPEGKALRLEASYQASGFFGGFAHQPAVGLVARLGKHLSSFTSYTHLVGHLGDDRRMSFGFVNASIIAAIDRNLGFDNFLRLDLAPGQERLGLQSRFRWRFGAGSELFVVYRSDLPLPGDGLAAQGARPYHELVVKMVLYLSTFGSR